MSDESNAVKPSRGKNIKLKKAAAPVAAPNEKASTAKQAAAKAKAPRPATPATSKPRPERAHTERLTTEFPKTERRQAAPRQPARTGRPFFQEPHQSRPRLFFALKVPQEIATPLSEAQKSLRGNWRAVRPEQFHVTLAYLPSVDPERIDALKRLGTRLAQNLAPLDVRLRGTGYFPNEGSPRVWFVKVEGEGLDELAAALRAELGEMGLEIEEGNFRAHITLARKKGPAPRVAPRTFELGWQAPQLVLYRSHLQKTGPIYEVLSTFKFRGEGEGK